MRPTGHVARRAEMDDWIFIGVTIAFFAVCWAYVVGCDRL
jgi:hypothetical protein